MTTMEKTTRSGTGHPVPLLVKASVDMVDEVLLSVVAVLALARVPGTLVTGVHAGESSDGDDHREQRRNGTTQDRYEPSKHVVLPDLKLRLGQYTQE